MRKIKLSKWKSRMPDGKEMDEDLLMALNVLIGNKKPEEIKRGIDGFRTMGRIAKAFEKADKSRVLELEEVDYIFLKEAIEKDIPSTWGFNSKIGDAIEDFLKAEPEK